MPKAEKNGSQALFETIPKAPCPMKQSAAPSRKIQWSWTGREEVSVGDAASSEGSWNETLTMRLIDSNPPPLKGN